MAVVVGSSPIARSKVFQNSKNSAMGRESECSNVFVQLQWYPPRDCPPYTHDTPVLNEGRVFVTIPLLEGFFIASKYASFFWKKWYTGENFLTLWPSKSLSFSEARPSCFWTHFSLSHLQVHEILRYNPLSEQAVSAQEVSIGWKISMTQDSSHGNNAITICLLRDSSLEVNLCFS